MAGTPARHPGRPGPWTGAPARPHDAADGPHDGRRPAPPSWVSVMHAAIGHGLDVVSGLHELISDDPDLRAAATRRWGSGCSRTPPSARAPRPRAGPDAPARLQVVLTVGTDCSIGKMTTPLGFARPPVMQA
ncbi:MAG: DUF1611 domain-containing protein [Chloroflexota bacterium]